MRHHQTWVAGVKETIGTLFKVVKMIKNGSQSQDRVITERTSEQKALRKTILAVSFEGVCHLLFILILKIYICRLLSELVY